MTDYILVFQNDLRIGQYILESLRPNNYKGENPKGNDYYYFQFELPIQLKYEWFNFKGFLLAFYFRHDAESFARAFYLENEEEHEYMQFRDDYIEVDGYIHKSLASYIEDERFAVRFKRE